jgi:hypothetical protein
LVSIADGVPIHEYVRLLGRHFDFQLPILREAGGRAKRDGDHEGETVYESSHLHIS